MTYMLCRNRLVDFARRKRVFDSHAETHRAAGLNLLHLWRSVDDPSNVFFLFEVNRYGEGACFHNCARGSGSWKSFGRYR